MPINARKDHAKKKKIFRKNPVNIIKEGLRNVLNDNSNIFKKNNEKNKNFLVVFFFTFKFIKILKSKMEMKKFEKIQSMNFLFTQDKSYFPSKFVSNIEYLNNPFIVKKIMNE